MVGCAIKVGKCKGSVIKEEMTFLNKQKKSDGQKSLGNKKIIFLRLPSAETCELVPTIYMYEHGVAITSIIAFMGRYHEAAVMFLTF